MKKQFFLAAVAAVLVIAGVVVSSVFLAEDNGDFSYIRQVWFSGNTWINIRIIMLCWVIMYISTYFIMYKKEVGYFIAALFLAVFVGAGIKSFADRSYNKANDAYDYIEGVKRDTLLVEKPVLILDIKYEQVSQGTLKSLDITTKRYRDGICISSETQKYPTVFYEVKTEDGNIVGNIEHYVPNIAKNYVKTSKGLIPAEVKGYLKKMELISSNKVKQQIEWTFTTKDGQQYTQKGTIVRSF